MMYVYINKKKCFVYNRMYIVLVFSLFFFFPWLYVDKEITCHHIHAHDQNYDIILSTWRKLNIKKQNNYPPGN